MKKIFFYFVFVSVAIVGFSSCKDDDDNDSSQVIDASGCYIVNYGSYGNGGSSITRYNYSTDSIYNNFNKTQNGKVFDSNIQFAGLYNNQYYFMGNSADQVFDLDKYMIQSQDAVSAGIEKPRYFVGSGNYLYISCWGNDADWYLMPGSYIAKFNITTRTVEKKIALPGGPEGLEIANGKLYAALNYKDSVAVISLSGDSVSSYIETPAVCSYFLKDNSDNLYVSLVAKGLGYINTSSDQLANTYQLDALSGNYSEIMSANSDFSKIYVCAGGWVNNGGTWVEVTPTVSVFDTNTKVYSTFISDVTGLNGVSVNPANDNVYVFFSNGGSDAGSVKIYDSSANLKKEFDAGIAPAFAFFIN